MNIHDITADEQTVKMKKDEGKTLYTAGLLSVPGRPTHSDNSRPALLAVCAGGD